MTTKTTRMKLLKKKMKMRQMIHLWTMVTLVVTIWWQKMTIMMTMKMMMILEIFNENRERREIFVCVYFV